MCNCLGRSSYRKESNPHQPLPETQAIIDTAQTDLLELELKPLVIDMESDDADTLDLTGEDVPAETVKVIAEKVKAERYGRKGVEKPRRPQPLKEIAGQKGNKIVISP